MRENPVPIIPGKHMLQSAWPKERIRVSGGKPMEVPSLPIRGYSSNLAAKGKVLAVLGISSLYRCQNEAI